MGRMNSTDRLPYSTAARWSFPAPIPPLEAGKSRMAERAPIAAALPFMVGFAQNCGLDPSPPGEGESAPADRGGVQPQPGVPHPGAKLRFDSALPSREGSTRRASEHPPLHKGDGMRRLSPKAPSRVLSLAAALLLPVAALAAPAERDPPNAPNQRAAFAGQTRAEAPANPTAVATSVVADGLPRSWAFEFLPDGRILTTQKSGEMRIVGKDGASLQVDGPPRVDSRGQGGLLDVALSPDFAKDRLVYVSFSEPRGSAGNGTSVARGRFVEEAGKARLEGVAVIFRQEPTWNNNMHFGSRLVFARDGRLFVTVGERSDAGPRVQAQDLASGLGKIFRIEADGTVPPDNPFVGREKAVPAIWSYGHRNLQSAALDAEGRLWTVEHGPRGGDELNRPEPGKNYGWPLVTYGIEYSGNRVGQGVTQRAGTEQPVYYWDPVIAPSGMAIYQGSLFPGWKGAMLVGGLVSEGLVVLRMKDDRVATEERIPLQARIRDVREGPDGAVYVLTEGERGGSRILRLAPKG